MGSWVHDIVHVKSLDFFSPRAKAAKNSSHLSTKENSKNIGGWGAELNREIVSCRACVRAVCMSSEFGAKKVWSPAFPFPFSPREFFPFPLRDKEKERERERKRKRKRALPPAPQSPIQLQLALSV